MQYGNDADSKMSTRIVESRENIIVLLLCSLAAIHVFIFSAAFPFFNNVDELQHFDLVLKYSHGGLPRKMEAISSDAADYIALMNSSAYLGIPAAFPGGQLPPPLWREPSEKMRADATARSAQWQSLPNFEFSQPPLYYFLAGAWWHIGQWMGLHDGRLVYWMRFLNLIFITALVWLAYLVARLVFPQNLFLRLAPPALLASMPQSAFYSIGNDVLPALCFGVTFLCLMQWLSSERPSTSLGAATGLAFAAAYLSKMTTLPLLAMAAIAILYKATQSARHGRFKMSLPSLVAFLLCSEPPILAWTIWCKSNFGDLTGSAAKTQFLGWTLKPFAAWWHHPIFTPGGLWSYLSGQLGTFWQGEFVWHHQSMALPGTIAAYTMLSLIIIALALPGLWANPDPLQRQALRFSLGCVIAALGFFALLSIAYDFHDSPAPSRQYPFLDVGRMLLGMLIPFLLLFVYGLDRALNRFGHAAKFVTLGAIISAMLALEITTDWHVFPNEYNWFHLP
jgi:hypothetical protein